MTAFATRPIRTRRLDLLPLRAEHAGEMAGVLGDPGLHAFIGSRPLPEPELRARYARLAAGSPDPTVSWGNWVVRLREQRCLTGTVQATVGPGPGGPVAELAWVIGTPWQRQGLAAEAARGLVGELRETTDVHQVIAHIHPGHHASAAVAAHAGLAATGEWHDGEVRWQLTLRRPT